MEFGQGDGCDVLLPVLKLSLEDLEHGFFFGANRHPLQIRKLEQFAHDLGRILGAWAEMQRE